MKKVGKAVIAVAVMAAAVIIEGCNGEILPEARTYTVTYKDGGETVYEATVPSGGRAEEKTPEEEYGYKFEYWSRDGKPYDFDAPVTEDIELEAVRTLECWTVFFICGGRTVYRCGYTLETEEISPPEAPERDGYIGAWEGYDLTGGDIYVQAVYYPRTYTARFYADGELVREESFKITDESIAEPEVPEREGYKGEWSEYEISAGDIVVSAEYTAEEYHVYFYADGELVATADYYIGDIAVEEPETPEKEGYTGKWEEYELGARDVTVNAVYTPEAKEGELEAAPAEEPVATSETDLEFKLTDGGYEVAGFKEGVSAAEVIVPSEHGGQPVVRIGDNAFSQSAVEKVTLPETLREIGAYAFYASNITEIELPDGLEIIGEGAFYNCLGLKEIEIPDGTAEIGDTAFYWCASLTKAQIGVGVKKIGKQAFGKCPLSDATFGDPNGWVGTPDGTAANGTDVSATFSSPALAAILLASSTLYFLKA